MIRAAEEADAGALADIYNHYVLNTTITFEEQAVATSEMVRRVRDSAGPWLVLERDGRIVGYSSAKPYHARSAYRFSVESTILLHPDAVGAGLGRRLYQALLDELAGRPVHRIVAAIALPNEASVALHERLGFVKWGHLPEIGRKFDRWLDVGYWVRALSGGDSRAA